MSHRGSNDRRGLDTPPIVCVWGPTEGGAIVIPAPPQAPADTAEGGAIVVPAPPQAPVDTAEGGAIVIPAPAGAVHDMPAAVARRAYPPGR